MIIYFDGFESKGKAIFSYMTQSAVADVVEYFDVDVNKDVPLIVAHQPANDYKYKSKKIDIRSREAIQNFVTGHELHCFHYFI